MTKLKPQTISKSTGQEFEEIWKINKKKKESKDMATITARLSVISDHFQ
jgi:hypothetical protein